VGIGLGVLFIGKDGPCAMEKGEETARNLLFG